ncbi:hypothetical protein CIPAW_10G074000 [Carya illinoinensis]|uniref:Uncharacterized protein n=1 Tax=Carya illinoinensis TaxID=32201 RepID=A0A8T1PCZ4_CARIL|nr:hypothetical protein CIPAW_10G074000 [Carya illinoinensis]
MEVQRENSHSFSFLLTFHAFLLFLAPKVQAQCKTGCHLALASYYLWQGSNYLTYISDLFHQQIPEILKYNPNIANENIINMGTRLNVPFSCDCLNGDFLGHTFTYIFQPDDTYDRIARFAFANLTTVDGVQRVNTFIPTRVPDNATINARHVSKKYGLFATYPLRPDENLSFVAVESGVPAKVLQMYNPGSDFSAGTGLVFVLARG